MCSGSEPRKYALKTESGEMGFQQLEQKPKGLAEAVTSEGNTLI
jgi:hypothetical protein